MFVSSLSASPHWQPFITQPVFRDSLAWIAANAATAAEGIHELGQPGWCVNVHGYTTQPEEKCVWENHARTIDLQYLIAGAEAIRVLPVEKLGAPTKVEEERDMQKFAAPSETGHLVVLRPGDFVIFMPGEAHCPKIALGEPVALRKLVVKIPVALLGAQK
jgi:YhcH/YjgK/YiaL family protein